MYKSITVKGEGNRYQRVFYTLTTIKEYLKNNPNGLRRFVVDEDTIPHIKRQFKGHYNVIEYTHKWGALIEESCVILEDKE